MLLALLALLPWLFLAAYMVFGIRPPRPLPEPDAASAGSQGAGSVPFVSIVVPARNEARNIRECVGSLAGQEYPAFEVVVVDDRSDDGTGDLVRAVEPANAREIRILHGEALPEGWFGKPWACLQGARATRGGLLLFTDADTRHAPDLLARAVEALREDGAAALSVAGRQEMVSVGERLVQPQMFALLGLRYPFLHRPVDPPRWRDAILNGQYILVPREVYDSIGGHEAVRGEVVEDLRLAQELVRAGHRISVRSAEESFSTRMYHSLRELVNGWTKNIWTGTRQAAGRLGAVALPGMVGVVLVMWVVPPVVLVLLGGTWLLGQIPPVPLAVWAGGATAISLSLWAGAYRRFQVPSLYALFYPLGAAVTVLIAVRSWLRGEARIQWKGRTYGAAGVVRGPAGG